MLRKAKGDHLDGVHLDQKVLEAIKHGRLVLVIRGQESRTSSRDQQARVHSEQMVLVTARWEAGPSSRATFCDDPQMRVLLAAEKHNLKKSKSISLFLIGSDEWGVVVDEDDDDGGEPIKLVIGPCNSYSGY
jgi:hypothetical protein